MEAAFAWLGKLMEWFGQFVPRIEIIDTNHGAVKFVRGSKIVPLGPGVHVYWPLVTKLTIYPTSRQASDLRSQAVWTADNKVLQVGGLLEYEIRDLEKILAHTWDPEQTIKAVALGAFHDVLTKMSHIDIRTGQETGVLALKLRQQVRRELKPYGVRVLKARLTDLAPGKVLRLIQSTSTDGI